MDDNNTKDAKNQSGSIFQSPSFDVPQALPQNPQTPSSDSPFGGPSPFDQPTPAAPPLGNESSSKSSPSVPGTGGLPPVDSGNAFLNEAPADFGVPPVYEESKSKYLIIGIAIVVFLFIFGGVMAFLIARSGGPKEPEPVTLTYWGLWEEKAIMDPIFQEYTKLNPHVTINYEMMDPVDYRKRVIERSLRNNGPDIFRYHNTWVPELTEVLAPLPSEVLSNEEFEKTFYPVHSKDLKIEDVYYGIPLNLDGMVLVYNDDLFKKAGVTTPPTSWVTDLVDTVNKITVQDGSGQIVTSGIAMGTSTNIEHFAEAYGILLLQNGGSLDNLNTTAAEEAMQVYREFAEKNIWNDSMPNAINAFAEGKVAMILVPSWQIITIKNINPEIPLKVAPVPRGLNNTPLSIASYWVEGVSKFSPHQVESWKLLKYMSSRESLQKLYEAQSKTRLFGAPVSRVDMADIMSQNEYLAPVIAQGEYYESIPVCARTFDDGLNEDIIRYIFNAVNDTAKGVSYKQALETAHQGVMEVYGRYKISSTNKAVSQ